MLLSLFDQLREGPFHPVAVLPGAGPMQEQLRWRGIPHTILNLNHALHKGRSASLRTAIRLGAWMLRKRVRLLHANGPAYYRCASVAAKYLGIPRICHLQLPPVHSELNWAFKVRPHATIACSADLQRRVMGMLSPSADTLMSIPNAVDVDDFKPPADMTTLRDRLGIGRASLVVTIVGLVSERKGHQYFLEMAQQVAGSHPSAEFVVVGEDILGHGAYRCAMEQYARELGIEKRVRFLGFREDASDWIAASDIVVLPTLEEGLPVSLIEAHACGKPVVATDVDGIPEIVEDGVTGILIPVRDTPALAKAVLTLLSDEELRRRMGVAARGRAERLFCARIYAEKICQLYWQLLG